MMWYSWRGHDDPQTGTRITLILGTNRLPIVGDAARWGTIVNRKAGKPMNLKQVKKLKLGDKFRRPSTNTHDNGYRVYRVIALADMVLTLQDQHGYHIRISTELGEWKNHSQGFMRDAEQIPVTRYKVAYSRCNRYFDSMADAAAFVDRVGRKRNIVASIVEVK